MKPSSILLLFLFLATAASAQTPAPPSHLAPILRAPGSSILGSVYLYKGRKLNSPFSVEVPIQELNDPVANRQFRQFRTWTTVGRLTGLASLAYVLFNRNPNRQTQRAILVGSVATSFGLTMLSNHQANQAVRRYNAVLGETRVGLMITPTVEGKWAGGVGLLIPVGSSVD